MVHLRHWITTKDIIDPKIVAKLTYIHRNPFMPPGLITPIFERLVDELSLGTILVNGLSLTAPIVLYNDVEVDGEILDFFDIRTTDGPVFPLYTYENKDDRIIFVRNGFFKVKDIVTLPTTDEQKVFLDFLFDSEGFYVENLGPVSVFPSDVYTFTSVKFQSMRMAWYAL